MAKDKPVPRTFSFHPHDTVLHSYLDTDEFVFRLADINYMLVRRGMCYIVMRFTSFEYQLAVIEYDNIKRAWEDFV